MYALNAVASFVWDGLDNGASVMQIVDELALVFDEPVQAITADVRKLVDQFVDVGIMSADGAPRDFRIDADECVEGREQGGPVWELLLPDAPTFDDRYLVAPHNY